MQGSVAIGNGLEIQGAVSLNNHIAIMTNYSYENIRASEYSSKYDGAAHISTGLGFRFGGIHENRKRSQ